MALMARRGARIDRRLTLGRAGNDRVVLACALAVGALAAAARLPGAIRDSFWEDEVSSAHVLVQSTPWGMVHQIARTEATPPLWYAIGWALHQLGVSPHGYRAMSVLAGALLAAIALVLARRLLPLWASVLAGLLVAFGWQFVMHGRELRAYELFALASVVFAWVLLRELEPRDGRSGRRRYGLALAVAFGALTNYFFLLTVAAALIWLWSERELAAERRRVAVGVGIGLIPLMIWSPVLVHQYLGHRFSWIGPFSVRGVIDVYWELFAQHTPTGGGALVLPLLLLAAVVCGCVLLSHASVEGRLMASMAIVPVVLSALAWLAGAHVFDPRNLVSAGPFAAVGLAALPAAVPRPLGYALGLAAAASVAVGAIVSESTPPTPYDGISAALVAEGWRPSDPTVLFGGSGDFFAYRSPLEWYLPGQPYLTLGEPQPARKCRAVFVVAWPGHGLAGARDSGLLASARSVGGVLVGRLRAASPPRSGFWRDGHVLVGRGAPECVRLVPEGEIVARLQA
jgi:hypothetical protein